MMRPRRLCAILALAALWNLALTNTANAASILFGSAAVPQNPFDESACELGDAGNSLTAPCGVGTGPYDGFRGFIGGENQLSTAYDPTDVFAFYWLATADLITTTGNSIITMSLHHYSTHVLVSGDADPDPSGVSYSQLPEGNYLLNLNALEDPPFTLGGFSGPTTASSSLVGPVRTQAIPEPSTFLLFGGAVLEVVRRRRQRR